MIPMKSIFGDRGLLASSLPGYEFRPGQLAMADQVSFALTNREVLLYEAPTGTGKTLAYLVPALLTESKIVISTQTKALQEQILFKDLPLAEKVLQVSVRTAVMKGRQNYLCKQRLKIFLAQPTFASMAESKIFEKVHAWSQTTKTGDREELGDLPDDFSSWHEINSHSHYCRGQRCTLNASCFFTRMRVRAIEADLVIVNHHLFFADLAVREDGQGEVIPHYQALVLDEAHQIEEVATQFFGLQVSNYRIEELVRDTLRIMEMLKIVDETVIGRLKNLRAASEQFFAHFQHPVDDRFRLTENHRSQEALLAQVRLNDTLEALARALSNVRPAEDGELIRALGQRAELIVLELDRILDLEDREFVHWCEIRRGGVFLQGSPIELKGRVSDQLFSCAPAMILCSATMSTGNNFDFFKNRVGLTREVIEVQGDPYFDYKKQAILYLPKEFPEPNSAEFPEALAGQYQSILLASQGRAFCLFTSYKNMHAVHSLVAPKLPYTVLLQGEGSKTSLLDRFRQDEHSVLFATASFWGGVDVAGSSLSVVLIDKLPFASPGEPVIEARIEALREQGGNPFMDYQLPQAIITLKQGLGRLIRHRMDRGMLGLFDIRVRKRHYGRRILDSLPDFAITGSMDDVEGYLKRLSSEPLPAHDRPRGEE